MLISPIMMVPKKLPAAVLQQEYLKKAKEMKIRIGPLTPNKVSAYKSNLYFNCIIISIDIIFDHHLACYINALLSFFFDCTSLSNDLKYTDLIVRFTHCRLVWRHACQ